MSGRGTLEKLQIKAYKDAAYAKAEVATFEAFLNPSEITLAWEMEYDSGNGAGTTGSRMNFKKVKPGDLSLTFFLDGTGANGRPCDVQGQVEEFQRVTGYCGEIHRPYYLKVMWGRIQVRRCVLKSASVAYKLFRPDGVPLRAVITATFTDSSDDQTRVALARDESPDLTHVRLLKAGENLPSLCHAIYGDPSFYLEVARVNGLDDFRNVPAGTRVVFPPVRR